MLFSRVAMKGLGTDEKVIIDVLCHRSNAQRQAISEAFNIEFNRVTLFYSSFFSIARISV
jgi:hypothetical protein